jgi:hypothetical protein
MLRSWRESSRALAAALASLFTVSLSFAAEPGLLWPTPEDQPILIAQAQCADGACDAYGGFEYAPVYSAPQGDYVVEQPACDIGYSCAEGMPSCDGLYGSCGDACSECCCCPLWTIRGEALFYSRTGGTAVPLVNAPVAIDSGDFDLGVAIGPRVTAIRHDLWCGCWDAEVSYFRLDNWSDTIALADMNDYQAIPPVAIAGVTPGLLTYDSSLQSGEVNLRRDYNPWVTWLAGFRWLEVNENLNATFGAQSHNVATSNQLFGGQLGLDVLLWDSGANLELNAVGKAGVFGNVASQTTTTVGLGGITPISVNGGEAAFVGELGLNGRYRWSDRVSIIGGYNVMWISGVALAPNQLATTNYTTGAATVDAGGTLFYHGANAGLEYCW